MFLQGTLKMRPPFDRSANLLPKTDVLAECNGSLFELGESIRIGGRWGFRATKLSSMEKVRGAIDQPQIPA
jgi:hypothetical protein